MSARMNSIAVVTASDAAAWDDTTIDRARAVGRMVAESGCNLITGGGKGGMAIVAQAFCETPGRLGRSIGVIPGKVKWAGNAPFGKVGNLTWEPKDESYPNEWIEIPIRTQLLGGQRDVAKGKDSRNIINVASADLVVVLPGGPGTQAELELALSFYEKRVYVLLRQQDQVGEYRQMTIPRTGQVKVVGDLDELNRLIAEWLSQRAR